MALYFDLKILKNYYLLILKIFEYTHWVFQENINYTLEQETKREAIMQVSIIYLANKAKYKAVQCLLNFLDGFEILKLEVRFCTKRYVKSYKDLDSLISFLYI